MGDILYKICTKAAFAEARSMGRFEGSEDDTSDGFIHLSAQHQLQGTLAKHFAGCNGLLLLAIDPQMLGDALRWETSRGGALFPHLYGPLDLAALLSVETLPLGQDGSHRLPSGVFA